MIDDVINFTKESLAEHDSELLDKVVEKLKAEINVCKFCAIIDNCDTEYFRSMCEKEDKRFIVAVKKIVDTVITEIKVEVKNEQKENSQKKERDIKIRDDTI